MEYSKALMLSETRWRISELTEFILEYNSTYKNINASLKYWTDELVALNVIRDLDEHSKVIVMDAINVIMNRYDDLMKNLPNNDSEWHEKEEFTMFYNLYDSVINYLEAMGYDIVNQKKKVA